MANPLKNERVEFADGHCQLVTKVQPDNYGDIVWLKRGYPNDPDWVYLNDLVWLEEEQRWLHVR